MYYTVLLVAEYIYVPHSATNITTYYILTHFTAYYILVCKYLT